jgi:hypothetical protein
LRAITTTLPNIPKLCCHVHCHIIKIQLLALQHFGLVILWLWARVIIRQIIWSHSILIAATFSSRIKLKSVSTCRTDSTLIVLVFVVSDERVTRQDHAIVEFYSEQLNSSIKAGFFSVANRGPTNAFFAV